MRIGFGSIIADDMGLGKTLQVITLLQKTKDDGQFTDKRAIIIVPTGLITNWQAELQRFAPNLTVFTYHGPQRSLKAFDADILLTTYGMLRSDITKLKKLPWRVAIIDEAQNIKNADTAQSKAVRSIPADTHIAMSGTPVENRLSEFWSIMDFCNSGYLCTAKSFKKDFANPIQRQGDEQIAERFRRITAQAQATDRAYRIGQHQNVLVHRFITQNTFEERIDKMIQDKRHLADLTVATGESWIGKLSNKELRELFE